MRLEAFNAWFPLARIFESSVLIHSETIVGSGVSVVEILNQPVDRITWLKSPDGSVRNS